MIKGEAINGYIILKDFVVAGGMSKVTFAEKGGKEYFIKEFLSPKYPLPDSPGSEKMKAQRRIACEAFEKHHRELNKKIGTKVELAIIRSQRKLTQHHCHVKKSPDCQLIRFSS